MSKIIIHNDTGNDAHAIELVRRVIGAGLVSGFPDKPQYCYATVFSYSKGKTVVTCDRRKGTDTFTFKVYLEHYKGVTGVSGKIVIDDVVP